MQVFANGNLIKLNNFEIFKIQFQVLCRWRYCSRRTVSVHFIPAILVLYISIDIANDENTLESS